MIIRVCVAWLILGSLIVGPTVAADAPSAGDALRLSLLEEAGRHFTARKQAIAAIKTPEDVARRQRAMKEFFRKSLGDFPERTPLNARVVGNLTLNGIRVENVIFESRPNHHVTANFYLPEGKPPFPGVLVPCGHAENAKAFADYQHICTLLAKNGIAAFCYDPIGQGERLQMLGKNGKPLVRNTNEHTMAGIGALLVGRQLASYRIWDGMRALDYLAGRPEVDPGRLGCTGNSGGGTLTSYLMVLDDRIAVAAPSCFITSLERLFATIGPQDAEQNITGDVAAGFDHADFLTIRAPRPTMMTVGTRDFFDIQGSWDTFREAKLIYGRLGFGERLDLFESDEPHGFTRPRRVATARWMVRWLLGKDSAIDEPDFSVAPDSQLQCTRTGQVLLDFPGEVSVFDLNRQKERSLSAARSKTSRSDEELRTEVMARLGLKDPKLPPVRPKVLSVTPGSGHITRHLVFEMEPGLSLPGIEVRRDGNGSVGATIVKLGVDWKAEPPGDGLSKDVGRIILVDPSGLGATTPTTPAGRQSPFGPDWQEGLLAFRMSRPLLGKRVADLLRILAGLAEETDGGKHADFRLVGVGLAGPIVLHAAVIDHGHLIKHASVERSLESWSLLIQSGMSRYQLSSVVPGALESYDLPDLVRALGPSRLTVHNPVDAMGEVIPALETRRH
jgi:cephalosporin-C deacetylase-like acetyl esterase